MKLLIALLLISNNLYADVCSVPVKITVGSPAPCTGYVFSNANELKVRTDLTFKDLQITNLTAQNNTLNDMLQIDNKQLIIYKSDAQNDKTLSEWEKVAFFGLGVLVTGLASYAVVKAAGK